MIRSLRLAVVAAVLAAGTPVLAWSAAHAASTTPYRTVLDVSIPMSDGVDISANLFLPTKGCPCPTILNQTPYRKASTPNGFAQHGYAEVITDVRGTGSSGGYWNVFGAREQLDGAEIVRWITRQPWSNGKIGLWGASYMAINQFLTVEQPGTSAVKAIFPIVPMSDSYRDVTWSGGAWDSSFMSWWYALVTGESLAPADYAASNPQVALNTESQHLLDVYGYTAPDLAGNMMGAYQHALCQATGNTAFTCNYTNSAFDGPDYRLRSPIDRISRVHVPTFIVGGTYDIFQRGEPLLYHALNLPATQKKLLIGPWYHVAASAGGNAGDFPAKDTSGRVIPSIQSLALAWFDHWLKGANNGIQNFPSVETYVLGLDRWVPNSSFPMSGTTYHNWYLSPQASGSGALSLHDGSLSPAAPTAGSSLPLPWLPANDACSRQTFQWTAGLSQDAYGSPTYCETHDNQNQIQGLTFTTPAMKRPYTLSG
ncbi:MAG: CocE/NonD family hydrolase, partial [Mycobacteriales bacterium]